MPVRRDPSADYPVMTGDGSIIVARPHDLAWTRPERPVERDPGPDYPVLNADGGVIVQEPYAGYTSGGPGPSQPVIPGTLRNPPMGMVLHWPSANEASHSPFIDVLKTATEWRSSPQSGQAQMNWAALVAGGHISPTGTVNSIPAGQDNLVMAALGYMEASSGASGRYRLFYSCRVPDAGNNIWIMGGASNTDGSVPGQIDFDFTANGSSSVTIMMVGVPSDGGGPAPITLTAMVKHEYLDHHAAGEVFDPDWLDVIRNNRVLRFGDWQRVDRYTGSAAWADRTPVDRVTYDGAAGVPFEHWFAVCNLVGADPWINILSPADDTYCTNLAAMARAQLGPSRRIYVELSNKVWDSTNWVTADHFRALAVAQFGDNSVEACMEAYGGRSAEVFAIWRAAWTGANAVRLRTVLQGWTGVAHHDSYILDAPRWVAAQSGRVAPWTLATDFALQNVIDGGLRYGWMPGNLALLDGWFADLASGTMTEQDLIEEFASALRGTNPAVVEQGYDIASLGANYDAHLTYLATRPLHVIAYEGGSHLCVPPERNGNQTWINFYRTFHRSPEGAAAFGDARAAFHAKFQSPETVYVYRCDVRKPDQNNSEGLYFYLGDTANNHPLTRWLADQAARQGAPGRGDEAFVGTMERQSAAPFVPTMLAEYTAATMPVMPALPPQLLPNPAMDDPAAWVVANGWTFNGDGTATHNTATGQYSRIAIPNADMGDATDVVLTFDIPAQTSNNWSLGVRARLLSTPANASNDGMWNGLITRSGDAGPSTRAQVSHVWNRVPGQTQLVLEAGNNWAGTISNPRLYDVSAARDLPTVVIVVAGQSNAEAYGAALADPTLDAWHPNLWMCPPNGYGGGVYGAKANTVTVAQEPLLHNLSPGHRAGFAMPAAKRIVSLTAGGARVVIVPVAKSGTGMIGSAAPWNPDSTATGDNARYDIMVSTYLAARSQITNHIGTIMLWSGNEYDMTVPNGVVLLPAAWANFAARARADMGVPDMPIIISGPVYPQDDPLNPLITVQRTLDQDSGSPNAIAGLTYLDGPMGTQWVNAGDTVHWSTAANRIRGDFAGQWAYRIGRQRGWWV